MITALLCYHHIKWIKVDSANIWISFLQHVDIQQNYYWLVHIAHGSVVFSLFLILFSVYSKHGWCQFQEMSSFWNRPTHLAPITMPRSKPLKSSFFSILTFWTSTGHLNHVNTSKCMDLLWHNWLIWYCANQQLNRCTECQCMYFPHWATIYPYMCVYVYIYI